MRRTGFLLICLAALSLGVSACGGPPPGALRPVGGGGQLTFTGLETRYIIAENVSLSSAGEMGESFIEEGGVKAEGIFEVVAGAEREGVPACGFPTPGQQLEKRGDKCTIGVKLKVNAAAKATFVLEYGGIGGTKKEAKATMVVER